MKTCDLHTHSIYSDGTCTPAEIVRTAVGQGLSAIALTDHNNVDGLPEFLSAAKECGIEAVAGAEFSVGYLGKEVHLLGLFLEEKHFPEISRRMKVVMDRKRQSNLDLIGALKEAGYELDFETIRASTPNGKFNRAHIAAELTRKGYTASVDDAFDRLLSKKVGYYKKPERLPFWEVLAFLKEIGSVPVLAHPLLNLTEQELETLLPEAKQKGLVGMECLYPLYEQEQTKKAFQLAECFGLQFSGGSDFHGDNRPDVEIGKGKGHLAVPYEWAEELKKYRG